MAHLYLGLALGKKGDFQRAQREIGVAVRLNPKSPKAHFYMGQVMEGAGGRPGALEQYPAASEIDPQNAQFR